MLQRRWEQINLVQSFAIVMAGSKSKLELKSFGQVRDEFDEALSLDDDGKPVTLDDELISEGLRGVEAPSWWTNTAPTPGSVIGQLGV